jgi:hypothetical protein
MSLDEAIKIAHSRSDHETISQAMELSHLIAHAKAVQSGLGPSAVSACEAMLLTSVKKYVQLDLKYAASRQACHYARYKCAHADLELVDGQKLWLLLQVAQLGDTKLLKRVMEAAHVKDAWALASSTSESAIAKAEHLLDPRESLAVQTASHIAAADLFLVLAGKASARSFVDLAIVSCLRAIRQSASSSSSVGEHMVESILRLTLVLVKSSMWRDGNVSIHDGNMDQLCLALESMQATMELPALTFKKIKVVQYLLAIHTLMQRDDDWVGATQASFALVDLVSRNSLVEHSFDVKVLSCFALAHVNSTEAIGRLTALSLLAKNSGMTNICSDCARIHMYISSSSWHDDDVLVVPLD